ncbi:hypothetical protein ScPMuIL_012897 [Solemya velum]
MATTVEQKFDAAVKVIHSLPKDGPFQPSYDMMKKFYGYYKQATEGPCTKAKPGFWDVYNRTKWESWKNNGQMPKEEAMNKYVEELKKTISHFSGKVQGMDDTGMKGIIEAMPQSETVAKFTETLGSFYEIVDDDAPVLQIQQRCKTSNGDSSSTNIESSPSEIPNGDALSIFNHSDILGKFAGDTVDEADAIPDMTEYIHSHVQHNSEHSVTENNAIDTGQNEQIHVSTEMPLPEPIVSGSDTEEEFCDTSDQPEETSSDLTESEKSEEMVQNESTPLKSKKHGNHVHFDPKQMIRTVAEIHENSTCPSPIRLPHGGRQFDNINPNFPFGHAKLYDQYQPLGTDSLLVHGPTVESLNASLASQLDETQNTSGSTGLSDFNGSFEKAIKNHGGETLSPSDSSRTGHDPPNQTARRDQRRGGAEGGGVGHGQPARHPGGSGRDPNDFFQSGECGNTVNDQIAVALIRLQQDMSSVLSRLTDLEVTAREKKPSWWPFKNVTRSTFVFILVWPFMVHWILAFLANKRKRPR